MVAGRPGKDLEALAEELLEWSTNPTAFNLIQFSRPRMISVTKLPEWASKDPKFREAFNLAKESIAVNRFEAMLEGALPLDEYKRNEHAYDPLREKLIKKDKLLDLEMDKKRLKYASDLKKDEDKASGKQAAEIVSQAIKLTSNIKP